MATYTPNMSVVVTGTPYMGQQQGEGVPMSYADNHPPQGMMFQSHPRTMQPGVDPNNHMSGSPRTVMMTQPYHHAPYNGPPNYPPYNPQRMTYTSTKGSVVHHGPMDKASAMPDGYMAHPSQYPPPQMGPGEHPNYFPPNMHPSDKMRYVHPPPPNSMNGPMAGPRTKSQVTPSMPPPSVSPLNHNMRSPHTSSPMHSSPGANNVHIQHRPQPPNSPRGGQAMPATSLPMQRTQISPSIQVSMPQAPHPSHVINPNTIVRNPVSQPPPRESLNNGLTPNITASPQMSNSMLSEEDIKNSASSSGHLAYSKQYELGDEPQRKKFLDVFKDFMEQNGTPCLRVPMADNTNNIPLDLYKLYREVCLRNGMPEVNKNKSWNEVAKALQIKDDKSAVNFLRKQYIKYLFAFECKFDHSLDFLSDHGPEPLRLNHDMRRGPELDKQPAPKRQATSNGPSAPPSSGPSTDPQQGRYPGPPPSNAYYNNYHGPPGSYPPTSQPLPSHPGGPDMAHNGVPGPPPNTTMPPGYLPPNDHPHPAYRPMYFNQYPPGHPAHGHPGHGPQGMYMRPPFQPHHDPHGMPPSGHPDAWRYRQPYPGPGGPPNAPPTGPTFYGEQQIQRYPANAVQPPYTPSPTPRLQVAPAPTKMSNLGRSKERAKSQSEAKKKAAAAQAAHLQHQHQMQVQPPPPPHHMSPMGPAPGPATSQLPPHLDMSKRVSSPYSTPSPMFSTEPPRIEHARPNINKRRKLTSKELGYVETIRLVMSLKSGLLTESTWVLNVLNVLLCDNTMVAYFYLGHHPNLLRMMDRLLDHFQKVLVEIFGEDTIGSKLYSDAKLVGLQPSTKKYKDVAPIDSANSGSDAYPTIRKNGLKALSYIDTVHEINSKLKLTKSYPVDLSELDQKYGETKVSVLGPATVDTLDNNKENTPSKEEKMEIVPSVPSDALREELSKIKEGPQINGDCTDLIKVEVDTDRAKEGAPDKPIDYENISEASLKALWKRLRGKNEKRVENESIKLEDDFLFIQSDQDRHLSERCASIVNIFRSLSFIPGNDMILSHHPGFLLMISQMLSLHHVHYKQSDSDTENSMFERCSKRSIKERDTLGLPDNWPFSGTLNTLRESSFCIIANISGQLDFSNFNEALYSPLIQSVVHWVTCPSSEAVDPFPPAFLSTITPQRLMLEALSKMSILPTNLSPIVRSVRTQLSALFKTLVLLLADRQQQVSREFSLVIMSNLSQTPGNDGIEVAKELTAFPQVISLLLKFLEDAEASAAQFALNAHMQGQSSLPPNISQEELCGGTSIDMLRRAALTLIHLAKSTVNKKLFLTHQHRVLNLAMSRFTHPRIGAMIANLLYHMESDWSLALS